MFVPPCMIAGGGLPYEILPANLIPGMDDVVRELPVFLAAADALNPLFLLQFPVREASSALRTREIVDDASYLESTLE